MSTNPSPEKGKKCLTITVHFLDNTTQVFQLQVKCLGQVLFDKVTKFLNLLEVDYFGLEYEDEKNAKHWLNMLKSLGSQAATTMHFRVKFYSPDPAQLEEEYTRYLFGLQVKQDLADGSLQCNENTAAVMISYIVQADFGDYNPEKCADATYLSGYKFVPVQDAELEKKIAENHKKIIGQTPADADLNLLETARRCEFYGIKLVPAKDHEGVPLNLAVAHLGVLVFQNMLKITTFSWAKIRKLSFKRKKFLIKLHPEGYGFYKDTVEFFFEDRNECKSFWKRCIENHTFFRCTDARQGMRQRPKIFSRGSSFRYSGRTQKQVSEFVRENCFKRQPFLRSTSLKSPSPTSPTKSPVPLLLPLNGSGSDICKEQRSVSEPNTPGIVSPAQDTDDNVSHDSYQLLEKEIPNGNETPVCNGKSSHSVPPESISREEDECRHRSRRHRVRVFSNHISVEQTSPSLYVRANRHLSYDEPESLCKAYPRTVDFVYVNQLPAVGSFSYRDDSVETPRKLEKPLGVDLLNDLDSRESALEDSMVSTPDFIPTVHTFQSDLVDIPNHYSYQSYKFSHIGCPSMPIKEG